MNFKLWYSFSLIFISYSLIDLWFETYKVNYQMIKNDADNVDNRFNLSVCIRMIQIRWAFKKYEDTEIDDVIEVSKFLNSTFQMLNRTFYLFSKDTNLSMPLRLSDSFIYANHVCFIANQKYYASLTIYRDIGLNLKLSINSQSFKYKFPHFIYLIRNRSLFNNIKISKILTQSLGKPFTNCEQTWFAYKMSNITNSINEYTIDSKFNCMNNCLKNLNNSNFYLYPFEENNNFINISSNSSFRKEKLFCFDQCKKENCLLELYMAVPNDKYIIFQIYSKAYPILTKLDYWLQFIGLISLFINISINETAPYLLNLFLNYFYQKFRKDINDKNKIICYGKIILVLINLIITILLSSIMAIEYLNCLKYPLTDSISNFDNPIRPFSIVFCTPLNFLLGYDYRNLTFDKIVNETSSGYDKIIDRIYLTYGSYEKKIKINRSTKIYFRECKYKYMKPNKQLSRCFRIEIEKDELHFQSLLTISTLIIETKLDNLNYFLTYLNDVDKEFNLLNSYLFNRAYKLLVVESKFIETSIAANCSEYSSLNLKCKSKSSCQSMCIIDKYLEKYNKLPIKNSVIDNDLLNRSILDIQFSDYLDTEIISKCEQIFPKDNCNNTIYLASFKSQITYKNKLEINLSFEKIFNREHECLVGKLVLSLINIFSIFFGLNFIKFSENLFKLLIKIKILKSNYDRLYKKIIFLLSSIGFLIHIFIIFNDIIQSNYVYSGFYKKNDVSDLPDLIFCFKFLETLIDPDHKLTGNYLDKLTNDINYDTIFKQIHYIDSDKKFVFIKSNEFFSNKSFAFKLWKFFYRDMKCLVVSPTLPYKEEDFYFEENLYPFKIYLTNRAKQDIIYFLSKKSGSKEMNEIYKFNFKENEKYTNKYLVTIISNQIMTNDLFKFFKNPWTLFFKEQDTHDTTKYLKSMENIALKKYGFLTKTFQLTERNFKYEINDNLFNQYYYQKQIAIDNYYPKNLNYKREIYHTYAQLSRLDNSDLEPEVEFIPNVNVLYSIYNSADNYATLFQNFLNTLSLWFSLGLLDFYIYFNRLIFLIDFIYKSMKLFKDKIDILN